MPVIRSNHLKRAQFQQKMADKSATNMAHDIHEELSRLHQTEADARSSKPLDEAKH